MPKTPEQCKELRDEMRQRILRLSTKYFAKNGFAKTRISDLSKHIGIGQGTIYLYFPSKEALFEEIKQMGGNKEIANGIRKMLVLQIPAEDKIKTLVQVILESFEEDELFAARFTIGMQSALEEGSYDSEKAMYDSKLYLYTAKIISQGQREGSMVNGNPIELADYFWSVVYIYALKSLYSSEFKMISATDLERILLKPKMV